MHQLSLEMHTDLEVQGLCLLCVQLISFAIVPLLLLILVILHHQTQHHALTNVTLEYAALKDKVSIFVSAVIEAKIVHSITCTDICSYHYTNLTVVREYEREVTGSHSTRAKNFSFSSSLDLDFTCIAAH